MAHDLAPLFLPLWAKALGSSRQSPSIGGALQWKGLQFNSRVGIAGGVDKSGKSLKSWQSLGAGFLEVGTITPRPQKANPGVIMKRSLKHWALWNRMGFPSPGVSSVKKELQKFESSQRVPLFLNIGKNRETPNDKAFEDYCFCMENLSEAGDVFVVNISSPNTKNLRDLQKGNSLKVLLRSLSEFKKERGINKPLLLKLSPDLTEEQLGMAVETSKDLVDGYILTNTTQSRENGIPFPKEGGLSGSPLKNLSENALKNLVSALGNSKKNHIIVSVGGVGNRKDIERRLAIGADLVQVYSSLVFEGPSFFQKL